jgi:hypothetical protein
MRSPCWTSIAVAFLQEGAVGAIGVVTPMASRPPSSTPARCRPNGVPVVANARNIDRDMLFRKLLAYGAVVAAVAAPLTWFVFVVLAVG